MLIFNPLLDCHALKNWEKNVKAEESCLFRYCGI